MTRKTPITSSGKAADLSSTSAHWISSPPTSGKVANVARFGQQQRRSGLRARTWSKSTEAIPIAVAGAGPSSAIASTSARKRAR